MKSLRIVIPIFVIFSLLSFSVVHKYYISNTHIAYVEDQKSIQIITRIFIDDFENVLKERYDNAITFDDEDSKIIDFYSEKYLAEKLKVKINGKEKPLVFIGKAIEMGVVKCYLEIEGIAEIKTIEVSNQVLFDLFSEQQNIIKLDINSNNKSYVLTKQKDKAVLNFN